MNPTATSPVTTAYAALARGAHAAQPHAAEAWRRATLATAVDDTDAATTRSCVVVAPHPDDETLGCGATIARKRAAGTAVTVVIVADGREAQRQSRAIDAPSLARLRAEEAVAACARLGVDAPDVVQLGHLDNHVADVERQVADELVDLLRQRRPAEVLVVSGLDHHPDHRAVNRAARHALRRWGADVVVGEFPVWSWVDGPWLDQARRRPLGRAGHLVAQPVQALLRGRARTVVTGPHLAAKRAALAAHATQTSAFTDEADWAVMGDDLLAPFLGPSEVFLPPARTTRPPRC